LQPHPAAPVSFPSAENVLASLDVEGWTVEQAGPVHVELSSPDGAPGSRIDNVLRLRRDRGQPPR
jgi:hypothetical protein